MRPRVLDYHRAQFHAAIQILREACIDIMRNAPHEGVEHRTAETLLVRLDDAIASLTGDGTPLSRRPRRTDQTSETDT